MVGGFVLPRCMSSKVKNSKVKQLGGKRRERKVMGVKRLTEIMVSGRNNLDIPERGPR